MGHKLLVRAADTDVNGGLLDLGICHLTGDGALPDQFVQTLLLTSTFNLRLIHIGGTDGLVSFLSTLSIGMILAGFAVVIAIETDDLLLAGSETKLGEIDRVSTHIGDTSVLIEVLRHHHCLADSETKFTGGFLLQGRSGERRCGGTLHGFLGDALHLEGGIFALLQESLHLFLILETATELGFDLCGRAVGIGDGKHAIHIIIGLALKVLDLTLALYNQAYGNTLHTTC